MIPNHLKRYVVEQDYSRYTPVDQAVWRYILRQLKSFLSEHAHPCYVDGLAKTGISVDRIPRIEEMSEKLEKFGWRAVPVSGFIPPAAFMEMQSLGYLPIASDMRTLDHLLYTPAPDIVHEAAGHAPILVDSAFADYLKKYASVARMAMISRDDLDQYEAIRALSDIKEDPGSTLQDIALAESTLKEVSEKMTGVSEAARLGRMNWWTAEYGLIGSLERPRIFGAGLLSSLGESRACLRPEVRKIPLTIECVERSYDITEPQPQLYVTPSFERLGEVLEELAKTMAYRLGGRSGLERAMQAGTANSIQLDSGLQVSGVVKNYLPSDKSTCGSDVAYIQLEGPCQLSLDFQQLLGHGRAAHAQGFGSPVGLLKDASKDLSDFSDSELRDIGIEMEERAHLDFKSGVVVDGRVTGWVRSPEGKVVLISFEDAWVHRGDEILFRPEWGTFDMAVGSRVASVFGGPADRERYGDVVSFAAKRVPPKAVSDTLSRKHRLFAEIAEARATVPADAPRAAAQLEALLIRAKSEMPDSWLCRLEIVEAGAKLPNPPAWLESAEGDLRALARGRPDLSERIEDGLRLARVP